LSGAKDYDTLASRGAPSKHAQDNLGSWGHEFVRSLAGEIGLEYNQRVIDGADPDTDEPFKDLLSMVHVIVPFHVTHNAEAEAVDLLIEVQRLKILLELDSIDANNYQRICLYLMKTANYMADPDDLVVSSFYVIDVTLSLLKTSSQHLTYTYYPLPLSFFRAHRKCSRPHTKSSANKNNTWTLCSSFFA
jgi:hypothetical protein